MEKFEVFFALGALFFQISIVRGTTWKSPCTEVKRLNGTISDTFYPLSDINYHRCWEILNPMKHQLYLKLVHLDMGSQYNEYRKFNRLLNGNLTIVLLDESKEYTFWDGLTSGNVSTKSSKVRIYFNIGSEFLRSDIYTYFLLHFQTRIFEKVCELHKEESGKISFSSTTFNDYITSCWEIEVQQNKYLRLQFEKKSFSGSCDDSYLKIIQKQPEENFMICHEHLPSEIMLRSNVKMLFYHRVYLADDKNALGFIVNYKIDDTNCNHKDRFHCTNYSCVPLLEVCDGLKDCENGADEVGCDKGILNMPGISEARSEEVSRLIRRRTSSWGWGDSTSRVITALYLAGAANFNGSDMEEELMAKQIELKTSMALLKKSISNEHLSTLINGLLVSCHSPKQFAGQNLVTRLKERIKVSNSFIHPIVYLTLCNAKESWPPQAPEDLNKVLNSTSTSPFIRDYKAVAVMAISCYHKATKFLNGTENGTLKKEYDKVVKYFKGIQHSDGSFGNYHSTSLITQALLSSGQELAKDWMLNATMKYLMITETSSHDLLASSLSLPVLNGKSLVDIAKVNCSAKTRTYAYDNIVPQTNEISVQYSLFIGEEKEIFHTISVRAAQNCTAFDVMKLAAVQDYNFKFKFNTVSNGTYSYAYVYEIGEIVNDPETGLVWLLYLGQTPTSDSLKRMNLGPDKLDFHGGTHLIMWYRKAYE